MTSKLAYVVLAFLVLSCVLVETLAEPEPILGLLLLKSALLGGYRRGGYRRRRYRRRRWHRSVDQDDEDEVDDGFVAPTNEQLEQLFLEASLKDSDDCAKSFICHVNAANELALDDLEKAVREAFGNQGFIDVRRNAVEFDLAAIMGRLAGKKQCQTIYARCRNNYTDMLKTIETLLPIDEESNVNTNSF